MGSANRSRKAGSVWSEDTVDQLHFVSAWISKIRGQDQQKSCDGCMCRGGV